MEAVSTIALLSFGFCVCISIGGYLILFEHENPTKQTKALSCRVVLFGIALVLVGIVDCVRNWFGGCCCVSYFCN